MLRRSLKVIEQFYFYFYSLCFIKDIKYFWLNDWNLTECSSTFYKTPLEFCVTITFKKKKKHHDLFQINRHSANASQVISRCWNYVNIVLKQLQRWKPKPKPTISSHTTRPVVYIIIIIIIAVKLYSRSKIYTLSVCCIKLLVFLLIHFHCICVCVCVCCTRPGASERQTRYCERPSEWVGTVGMWTIGKLVG